MHAPSSKSTASRSVLHGPGGRPARIGLVLGGGGASGLAFHAGVLWALHHDLGWDPRTADIIVGTSAGSIVGALLRSDVATEDLAAWATDADPSTEGHLFRTVMKAADDAVTPRSVPTMTMPGWHMLNALRHPSQIPGAIASFSSRRGRRSRCGSRRYVSAASCAVPVLARPVRIGNHRYVVGGVKSATHAGVLSGEDVDLVIVLSPMGHQAGRNPLRSLAHRHATPSPVRRFEFPSR